MKSIVKVWVLGLAVCGACGARSPASEGGSTGRGRPGNLVIERKFEKDVQVALATGEGKFSEWQFYKDGKIINETDTDGDGKADVRRIQEPANGGKLICAVEFIDGRWRIVLEGFTDFLDKTEKFVDGKWTGTFEEKPSENDPVYSKYVDGALVESRRDGKGQYYRMTKVAGVGTKAESGKSKDEVFSTREEKDGKNWIATNYEVVGRPSDRETMTNGRLTMEIWRDGKWTGDFEKVEKLNRGGGMGGGGGMDPRMRGGIQGPRHELQTLRTLYKNGLVSEVEILDERGNRISIQEFKADGTWWKEHVDVPNFREGFDGKEELRQQKVDGKWIGDFTVGEKGETKREFKGGRLVREEFGKGGNSEGFTAKSSPSPGVERWWKEEKLAKEQRFELLGEIERLVYEARDLDGDGKMDLVADLEKLTITQPENPKGP